MAPGNRTVPSGKSGNLRDICQSVATIQNCTVRVSYAKDAAGNADNSVEDTIVVTIPVTDTALNDIDQTEYWAAVFGLLADGVGGGFQVFLVVGP